jgi:hypothetical protein
MSNQSDDKKKIGGVSSSQGTKGVKATEGVSEVERVKGASAIRGVSGVSGVGRAGAIGAMSFEQREKLLSIVSQEAEKLANQGALPKSQKEIVEAAVKMAIDASLIESLDKKK